MLPQNAAACDIICVVCRSTFLKTTKPPQYVFFFLMNGIFLAPSGEEGTKLTRKKNRLLEHAQNKHNKAITDCFPALSA